MTFPRAVASIAINAHSAPTFGLPNNDPSAAPIAAHETLTRATATIAGARKLLAELKAARETQASVRKPKNARRLAGSAFIVASLRTGTDNVGGIVSHRKRRRERKTPAPPTPETRSRPEAEATGCMGPNPVVQQTAGAGGTSDLVTTPPPKAVEHDWIFTDGDNRCKLSDAHARRP